jgi:hypothetical protein
VQIPQEVNCARNTLPCKQIEQQGHFIKFFWGILAFGLRAFSRSGLVKEHPQVSVSAHVFLNYYKVYFGLHCLVVIPKAQ